MAERTPKTRASYEAVATTPRWPTPPTTTGLPRSDGLSRCSTEAKKASRSRCRTEASRRTGPSSPSAATVGKIHARLGRSASPLCQARRPPMAASTALASRPFIRFNERAREPYSTVIAAPLWWALYQPVMVPWHDP